MREALRPVEEDHVARRVAGAVIDLELVIAEGDGFAFLQKPVGRDIAHALAHAVFRGLGFDALQQWLVVLVRADHGNAEPFPEFVRAACVIQMTVSQPDLLQRQAVFPDDLQDRLHVAAGIDDDAFLGVLVEENGTILLERSDGDDTRLQHAHGSLACYGRPRRYTGFLGRAPQLKPGRDSP